MRSKIKGQGSQTRIAAATAFNARKCRNFTSTLQAWGFPASSEMLLLGSNDEGSGGPPGVATAASTRMSTMATDRASEQPKLQAVRCRPAERSGSARELRRSGDGARSRDSVYLFRVVCVGGLPLRGRSDACAVKSTAAVSAFARVRGAPRPFFLLAHAQPPAAAFWCTKRILIVACYSVRRCAHGGPRRRARAGRPGG
eukprot:351204-Chlamydomonas_euryale.AAC.6